ncbi:MAG: hypothetical protein ABTQ32_29585 [Myxococcaceae bacterium]
MGTFIEEGGAGMIPTMLFGFAFVASAVMSISQPERRWLSLVFGALTFSSGLLGTAMGLINTMRYVAKTNAAEQLPIGATGIAESLNNLVLSNVIIVIGCLISAVAAFKHSRPAPRAA